MNQNDNGFLTTILHLAVTKLQFKAEDAIWQCPLMQLLLLLRQDVFAEAPKDKKGMQLSLIEKIDVLDSSNH